MGRSEWGVKVTSIDDVARVRRAVHAHNSEPEFDGPRQNGPLGDVVGETIYLSCTLLFRNERYLCLGSPNTGRARSYASDYLEQTCKGLTIFHPFDKPHGWHDTNDKVWDPCQCYGQHRAPPCNSVPIPPRDGTLAHYGDDMRAGFLEHVSWQLPTDATVFGSMPSELPELLAARQRLAAATAIGSTTSASPFQLQETTLIGQVLQQIYILQQTCTHAAANAQHGLVPGLQPLPYTRPALHVPVACIFPQASDRVLDRFVLETNGRVQAFKAQGNDRFQQIPTSVENYTAAALLYTQAAEMCCHDNILRAVILSNLAQCFLNLDSASAAVGSASIAVALDPTNVKAQKRLAAAKKALKKALAQHSLSGAGKRKERRRQLRNKSSSVSADLPTRLLEATIRGDCNAISKALDDGADVNAWVGPLGPDHSDMSFTALCCAVNHQHIGALQFLLDHKADPNGTTSDGISALMGASILGHEKMMNVLLNAGANPNQQLTTDNPRDGQLGFTAFHWACGMGSVRAAKVLARNGCNLWIQDERGRTGLDIASGVGEDASHDDDCNSAEVIEELRELVHSTPAAQSEFDCLICLENFEPMIKLGCACRGSSGRVHEKCLVGYAQHDESSWDRCFTCKRRYTGTTAVRMATIRFEMLKDRPMLDPERLQSLRNLALTLSGGGPDQVAFDQKRAKHLMMAYVDGTLKSLSRDGRPWGGPNADWKTLPDIRMLDPLHDLAILHMDEPRKAFPLTLALLHGWRVVISILDSNSRTLLLRKLCLALEAVADISTQPGIRDAATEGNARELYEESAQIREEHKVGDPIDLIELRSNYAITLDNIGDTRTAMKLSLNATIDSRRLLGAEHPISKEIFRRMSTVKDRQGKVGCIIAIGSYVGAEGVLATDSEVYLIGLENQRYTCTTGPISRDLIDEFSKSDATNVMTLALEPSDVALAVGTMIVVHGLSAAPELNQRCGLITAFNCDKRKYHVKFEGGEQSKPHSVDMTCCTVAAFVSAESTTLRYPDPLVGQPKTKVGAMVQKWHELLSAAYVPAPYNAHVIMEHKHIDINEYANNMKFYMKITYIILHGAGCSGI